MDVRSFGAQGDGSTDDTQAILDAIEAAESDGVVYFPAGVYRTTQELAVNVRRVTVRGDGPQCTTIASEAAVALTLGWDSAEAPQRAPTAVSGLALTGTGVGVRFFHPTGQAHSITLRDVGVYGFGVGVDLQRHTYLLRFDRVFFHTCQIGLRLDDVVSSGENISLTGCVFSGITDTCVYANKSGASLYFNQCSFDYSKRALWQRAGVVSMSQCHFETDTRFGPGGEMLLLDRRGFASRPLLNLSDCDFYDTWNNYDTTIRCRGDNGDNGLRVINPHLRNQSGRCPYLVRDDGPYQSSMLVSGAWYGNGGAPPKLRERTGVEYPINPTVAYVVN